MPYRLPSCSAARMRSCVVGFLSTICSAPLPTPSFSFPFLSPLITLVRYCNIFSLFVILFSLCFFILFFFLFVFFVFFFFYFSFFFFYFFLSFIIYLFL